MKKQIIFVLLLFTAVFNLYAQQPDYNVVFDMSTRDTVSQLALVREVELIRKYNPEAKIEVVVYGHGINLVLNDNNTNAEAINRILADGKSAITVCAFTMKRLNLTETNLIPGVKIVPDGIYEIITKQHEGWGYIKAVH